MRWRLAAGRRQPVLLVVGQGVARPADGAAGQITVGITRTAIATANSRGATTT